MAAPDPLATLDSQIMTLVQAVREHQHAILDQEEAIYQLKLQLAKLLVKRGAHWSGRSHESALAPSEAVANSLNIHHPTDKEIYHD